MSNDLNNCTFIGRMVQTPEIRDVGNTAICNFTLACGWKTKEKEGTEYIRCVAYNRLAEVIGEYVTKGQQMYVAGRQSTRKYEDKDGITRYSTEIVIDRMQMLAKPANRQSDPKPQAKALEDLDSDPIPF